MAQERFVPYLNISSRLSSTPDADLLQRMGGRGFPYFVVLDPEGVRVVPGKAYPQFRPMTAEGTEVALAGVVELLEARIAAERDPDDAALAANRMLIERLLLDGTVSDEEAKSAAEVEGADATLVQRYRCQEVLLDYTRAVRGLAKDDQDGRRAAFDRAGRAMLAVHKSGTALFDTRLRVFSDYWRLVFTGAILDGEVEIAETALSIYRKVYGTSGRMRERLDKMATDLEKLKERSAGGDSTGD